MPSKSLWAYYWPHVRPFKYHWTIMMIAPIVDSFHPFAYNYAVKMFLDLLSQTQEINYHNLLKPIILFITTSLMIELVWRVCNVMELKSKPYIRQSILLSSYNYVQHHAYSYFQNNFSGAISSKLKSIMDGYDKLSGELHHGLFRKVLSCIINLCALSVVSINLSFFVLLWAAVYVPVMYKLSSKMNSLSFQDSECRHSITGLISDKITNITSVFSFANRRHESSKLNEFIKTDFIPKQLRLYKFDLKVQVFSGFMYVLMLVGVLCYVIYLKIRGIITIGDVAFVLAITLVIIEDIWRTAISMLDFSRLIGDTKSALSVVQAPQQLLDRLDALPLVMREPAVEFKNVRFGYSDDAILFDNLNLTIQPGEKIGLVGSSGAGKSTLINLLLKYYPLQAGAICVDHQDIAGITQDSLRAQIAVIPQDTMLFHRSLLDNIRYGRVDASDTEVVAASQKAHIHDFIMELPEQYQTFVGERGIKLSGGQRQRIAIARAFLKDAPIIILDEATSALDSQTEKSIQDSLNHIINDQQKTIIAIAHRLSTLKYMDRIIVLNQGKISEQGTHDTLMSNPTSLYKKLWDLQLI